MCNLKNAANPVLVIDNGEVVVELPVSKDILSIDGTDYDLEGIVVATPMTDGDSALAKMIRSSSHRKQ